MFIKGYFSSTFLPKKHTPFFSLIERTSLFLNHNDYFPTILGCLGNLINEFRGSQLRAEVVNTIALQQKGHQFASSTPSLSI